MLYEIVVLVALEALVALVALVEESLLDLIVIETYDRSLKLLALIICMLNRISTFLIARSSLNSYSNLT